MVRLPQQMHCHPVQSQYHNNASSQINKAVRSYENLANSVGETTRVVYYNSTTMRRLDDTYKKTKPKIEQVTQSSVKFNYQVKEQTKSIRNLKKELHSCNSYSISLLLTMY